MLPELHRRIQRRGWDRASSCYERFWRRQLRPATDLVLATASLRTGEHVIDVACGTGSITLPAAMAVGASGRVVGTDLAPKMVAEVERRAAAAGLTNLDVEARGAEELEPVGSYDVAVCALGLMYVPDPAVAARALLGTLRPGGRAVVSVWGERARCGWAELFPIVAARVASDVCPMFFALGVPGALVALLADSGFVDVRETRLDVGLDYADDDDALGAAFSGGPVALAWSRFDAAARRSAAAEYLRSIAPFATSTGYRVPGQFVVASARRPAITRPATTTPRGDHAS